ncbi:hypothetical protein P4S81_12920 [Pseudoalteromonas sp. B28]
MTDQKLEKSISQKTFVASILASIVASIIVIALIQPLLTIFWHYISGTGSEYFNSFVDGFYQNAALGRRNWVISILAIILIYIPFVVTITIVVAKLVARNYLDRISEDKSKLVARNYLDKISEDKSKTVVKRTIKKLIVFLFILVLAGLFISTLISSYIYTDMQLNTSFDQRLTVLKPHITVLQEEELKASWALMTSKNDYLVLNETMENYAKTYNIVLPRELLDK